MLSVTFFFNQTDKIRFWSIWAINSFLGIWMTVEQIKLSGFFIRPIWHLQIGGRRKIRDRKTHVFFKKHAPKIQFWYNIFSAIILRSRLDRVAPTTPLGVVLRYFWECMTTTGDGEQWIQLSDYLAFCEICECTDPNVRSAKMIGLPPRGFTTPRALVVVIHSRKRLRAIPNGVVVVMRTKRERRTRAQKTLYRN